MQLSRETKITPAILPSEGVAGTADITAAIIDMAYFDGLLIEVVVGEVTAGAVTSIKAQQGEDSALADAADLLGSGQAIADTDDDKTFYIDIFRPQDRYLRLYVDRGTQNAVIASATYYQYSGKANAPRGNASGVSGEVHVSPAEGTA
jgi:hypothetical protein